mmetsp:Transcript_18240/g.54046  ORF Transcript_18240/g.54046 Transcript_18240/m.54046 type:complete len:110 (+) Transcript_18240:1174-1503(+)
MLQRARSLIDGTSWHITVALGDALLMHSQVTIDTKAEFARVALPLRQQAFAMVTQRAPVIVVAAAAESFPHANLRGRVALPQEALWINVHLSGERCARQKSAHSGSQLG